jgi:hypothetical protein
MATRIASALRDGARVARGLLQPHVAPLEVEALLSQDLEARILAAINETLEYHCTHRPPNTARNYAPKQKEWKVSPTPLDLDKKLTTLPTRLGAKPRGSPLAGNTS